MPSAKKAVKTRSHITKGNVFDDLGLSRTEALEAKIKADLWRSLVDYIGPLGLTQKQLGQRLGVHQPEISNLLNGKISKFSTDTLIHYAATLHFDVQLKAKAPRRSRVNTLAASAIKEKVSARRSELVMA